MKKQNIKIQKRRTTERKTTETDGLTPKQAAALPFFVGCQSIEAGCKAAKISKSVFYEWQKQDIFRADLERLRAETINGALSCLKSGVAGAVEKLLGLLESSEESIQLRAAQTALDHFLKVTAAETLEARLAEIEKKINSRGGKA